MRDSGQVSGLNRALARAVRVLFAVQRLSLIVMVGVMCSLVLTRYVFLYSPSWSEELTVYLMIWNAMLGTAALVLFNDHIALLFVVEAMPPRLRRLADVVVQLCILIAALLITVFGYQFMQNMSDSMAMGLGISMRWSTLALPVGGALAVIAALLRVADSLGQAMGRPPLIDPALQGVVTDSRFHHAQ